MARHANGRPDAHRKGEGPRQQGSDDKERQAVEEALPDFRQHRLVVAPGDGLAAEKVTIEEQILHVKRLIQVKLLAHTLYDLWGEFGIERVDLARFAWREMDNQERYDRYEKEGDHFLN